MQHQWFSQTMFMKQCLAVLLLLLPFWLAAQQNIKETRKKSYETLVYKISADSAEKYMRNDSIPIDIYLPCTPYKIFPYQAVEEDSLTVGHYLLLSIYDNEIVAEVYGISNLFVYPVNNQHRVQLAIKDKEGNTINKATVFVDGKPAAYNTDANVFIVKQSNPDESFVKVYGEHDTTFLLLEAEYETDKTPLGQRLANFKYTHVGSVVMWVPEKVSRLFGNRYSYSKRYKYKGGSGYMLFNQPKYKLTDTVKLKTYIVDRHKKRYRKEMDVYLQYYDNVKLQSRLLNSLKPVSPGSYVYNFPLSDTLPNDLPYDVIFKTKKKQQSIKGSFRTEDYVLDEIGKYDFRSVKDACYKGDSLIFFATANDANGLSLLDAKAKLVLTRGAVLSFEKDTVYVPDSLFAEEKPMQTEGETKFVVYTGNFPAANFVIDAELIFRNSNNELHTEKTTVTYKIKHNELYTAIVNDSIIAEYRVSGKSIPAKAVMEMHGEVEKEMTVDLPFKMPIDPFAEKYTFYLLAGNTKTDSASESITERYNVEISRLNVKDSFGFVLHNPYKIPVYYSVFYGNNIIYYGSSAEENIKWLEYGSHKKRLYKVKWQYVWGNEPYAREQSIALLYKVLDIKITNSSTVFPGQKDTITVDVKDYKGKPAQHVNLSAVGYSSQFKNSIKVPEPPYLQRYHNKRTILFDKFESDDAYTINRYKIGKHISAIQKFRLDTMLYYKMLFPLNGFYDAVTPISDFIPQVSVYVVQKGVPQEIYLLYINRTMVYYNGVTDKSPYAFPAFEGYSQIAFRLKDQYIEVDSVYLQPFYKHDIVFDLDKLPYNSVITVMPPYYTNEERRILENSIWQLAKNYKTDNGYVWQGSEVIHLNDNRRHLVGPFSTMDSIHFFAKNDFDIHFKFEPGYEYNLSKQIARLEKKPVFYPEEKEIRLPAIKKATWVLGDTLLQPPVISYTKPGVKPYLRLSKQNKLFADYTMAYGSLQINVPKDTTIDYIIIEQHNDSKDNYIISGTSKIITNLAPCSYSVFLISNNYTVAAYDDLIIEDKQLLCINSHINDFITDNKLVNRLSEISLQNEMPVQNKAAEKDEFTSITDIAAITNHTGSVEKGNGIIQGNVIDKKGKLPVAYASVMIKGTSTGTTTNTEGNFGFINIHSGTYTLVISSVGYESLEIVTEVNNNGTSIVKAEMKMMAQHLSEVVVVGYGSAKRKELTGSVTTVGGKLLETVNVTAALSGKAAGISFGQPGSSTQISIRGLSSLSGNNKPLYIIDGIAYDELPANIQPEMIGDITVLSASEAAIYGTRGANGVIIINTGSKQLRTQFRDYAFWQPEFFTDENGQAKFAVQYPENITGWEAYVLAMDKHKRIGKASAFIKSFKPVIAQLSIPQFLLQGDSVQLVGKNMNYTEDLYTAKGKFTLNGSNVKETSFNLPAKESFINYLAINTPGNTDTLKAGYTLETITGYKDGEERKIPIFKPGTEETQGSFWILPHDTSFSFTANSNAGAIEISVQSNTLDLLLDELKHLKEYPYYCMEQTSSKLRGLLMEQKIMQTLGKPFKEEKQIQQLLQKLQKAQLFDGGWAWWQNGKADVHITNYIIQSLLALRSDPVTEQSIRNGLLYLQNNLPVYHKDQLLSTLLTMSKAGHVINYTAWFDKLNFDSLTQQQQWLYAAIKQNLGKPHKEELQKLISKAIPGMLGSMHWGEENFSWYGNANATTVLAYEVLQKENDQQQLLLPIMQYFLQQRKRGYWNNTVESATITNTILPGVLKMNKDFTTPSSIRISGDTSFTINSFPYQIKTSNSTRQMHIERSGGGLIYMSIYQRSWNNAPQPVQDHFSIKTHFEKNKKVVSSIQSGEQLSMLIDVDVKKEAEYVMLEVPIPAGCIYASKNQDDYNVHKEFMKNKVVLFLPLLTKGMHHFEVQLEPRYTGRFTLNPVKSELMYFPLFYGRNEITQVDIK